MTTVPPVKIVGRKDIQVPLAYMGVVRIEMELESILKSAARPRAKWALAKWVWTIPLGTPVVPEL
jgi:hypothetical protein